MRLLNSEIRRNDMGKIVYLKVDKCNECPHYVSSLNSKFQGTSCFCQRKAEITDHWNHGIIGKSFIEPNNGWDIPKWCPLPDESFEF